MRKSALAVVVALFFYTLTDIMIWQRIFESHNLGWYAPLYHPGWSVMLFGELILGALLLAPNWRAVSFYVSALCAFATCGLEDVLYYWLDGRAIPYWLPWLDSNPIILFKPVTATHLLLSASLWVAITALAFILLYGWEVTSVSQELRGFPRPVRVAARPRYSNRRIPFSADSFDPEGHEQSLSQE